LDGIINILKPVGMTSSDVVRWVRKKTKADKAGHIGTLDPGAAGVLPVFLGKATRLAEYHSNQDKEYRAEITFGITTDTQDAFGSELSRSKSEITREGFLKILPAFLGSIEQVPPMYSAVRKNGKHLYEYARQGIEVDREKRVVKIEKLSLIDWQDDDFPKAIIDIECSKGTYIRTLCQDLGEVAGCGAHMSFLLRLRAGCFTLENSHILQDLDSSDCSNDSSFVLSPEWGLKLPHVCLPANRLTAFINGLSTGCSMIIGESPGEDCSVQVFCEERFIGVGIIKKDSLCPIKVLF